MPEIRQTSGATREANNVVRFENGQKFEIYGSRILIIDADASAQLELNCRATESFYDSNDVPMGREVFWPSNPKWSDGRALGLDEATELAKKVKITNDIVGHKIRQIFENNTVRAGGHYEFNSF